jgi:hypothetical protein
MEHDSVIWMQKVEKAWLEPDNGVELALDDWFSAVEGKQIEAGFVRAVCEDWATHVPLRVLRHVNPVAKICLNGS